MNQKLQAAVSQREEVCYLKLSGVIDEDNALAALADQVPSGTAVINLGEVERINSCGVRDWVNWLGRLEKNDVNVVLVECSPAIVAQINLVHNFTGGGAVKSFFAPYFCPSCDLEKVLLIEAAEMAGQNQPRAPTCRCDECDGVMDFDDMEESYFAFVSTGRKVVQNAKIDAVLNEFIPADSKGERKIRSRVNITAVSGTGPASGSGASLPSVPSLPVITRPGGSGFSSTGTGSGSRPGSRPGLSFSGTGSRPGINTLDLPGRPVELPLPRETRGKSRLLLILVVVLLMVAIGLLTYVIFGDSYRRRHQQPKVRYDMKQTAIEMSVDPAA